MSVEECEARIKKLFRVYLIGFLIGYSTAFGCAWLMRIHSVQTLRGKQFIQVNFQKYWVEKVGDTK